jgi:hypothetical protein
MIIQIPIIGNDLTTDKRFAIEFDSDKITRTSIARGVDHHGDGGMTMNDSVDLTFHFDDHKDGPKWVEIPQKES